MEEVKLAGNDDIDIVNETELDNDDNNKNENALDVDDVDKSFEAKLIVQFVNNWLGEGTMFGSSTATEDNNSFECK